MQNRLQIFSVLFYSVILFLFYVTHSLVDWSGLVILRAGALLAGLRGVGAPGLNITNIKNINDLNIKHFESWGPVGWAQGSWDARAEYIKY